MSSSMKKFLLSAITMILLLSACAFPAQPTQSATDVENQVGTAVALTVAAQNAQTQAAQSPTPIVTNTMLPTQTPEGLPTLTPIIPTVTPVTLPTTAPSGGGGGGGTTIKPDYACNAFPRKPFDNQVFHPNNEFDIKWTIVNTGRKTLRAGLDVKYSAGTKLTTTDRVELPELKPGDQYVVELDAKAPNKQGKYIMTFIVEGGLCYPYTAIVVE
jgi:hypothetical protein